MIKHTLAVGAVVGAISAVGHLDGLGGAASPEIHGTLTSIPGNVCTSFQGVDDGAIVDLCSNALDDCRPLGETGVELFCVAGDRARI